MKNYHHHTIACLLLSAFALSSCIRDDLEPCRPLTIDIEVLDRNYSNISEAECVDAVSPDTPFGEIAGRVYLKLVNIETGQIVSRQSIEPSGQSLTCPVTFSDSIAFGKYAVTVWGGRQPLPESIEEEYVFSDTAAAEVLYMVCDTLDYTPGEPEHKVGLRRMNGLLSVLTVNMPPYVTTAGAEITGLYRTVGSDSHYSGIMDWRGSLPADTVSGIVRSQASLPPSTVKDVSAVTVSYYAGNTLVQRAPKLNVTIERNKITQIKYEWDETEGLVVYLNVDGTWQLVSRLEVDEQ